MNGAWDVTPFGREIASSTPKKSSYNKHSDKQFEVRMEITIPDSDRRMVVPKSIVDAAKRVLRDVAPDLVHDSDYRTLGNFEDVYGIHTSGGRTNKELKLVALVRGLELRGLVKHTPLPEPAPAPTVSEIVPPPLPSAEAKFRRGVTWGQNRVHVIPPRTTDPSEFVDIRPQSMRGSGESIAASARPRMAGIPRQVVMEERPPVARDRAPEYGVDCDRIGKGVGGTLLTGGTIAASYLGWAALSTPPTGLCIGCCVITRSSLFICGAVKAGDEGMGIASGAVGLAVAFPEAGLSLWGGACMRDALCP